MDSIRRIFITYPLSRHKQAGTLALSGYCSNGEKMVEASLQTYTLYYRTKQESYGNRLSCITRSHFPSSGRQILLAYYFGNDFLVAPVMNSENRRDVYLPEGKWVNFFTGERYEGGQWLRNLEIPLEEMPVYVRENASISVYNKEVECTDEMDLSQSEILHIDTNFKGIWK